MTEQQVQQVKNSWSQVTKLDPVVVGQLFYSRLFDIAPELRPMFRSPVADQSRKLMAMIGYIINKLDKLGDIIDEVGKLAKGHVKYEVRNEHYTIVGEALLWTLEKGLAGHWTEELKSAWVECYSLLAGAMIAAAESENKAA